MPIHIRAEPGDYAEACLLPGDPLRAKYIAETYFDDVTQRNSERGLLGYSGTYKGKPVSVQGTGMGCPGATIVFEELIQLGCKKLIRVGTCGGLQPHHQLGDLIVALTAVPADSTAMHLVGNEPHCPTASWSIIHGAVHTAKEIGQELHVGPIVSSDLFYNPDDAQYERWSKRGVLAVEAGAQRVVAAGGDGTLNEVVNGVAERDVDLATIPLGTGMDFGRTYGIPTKFDDAVRVALTGETRTVDAGRVRYRTWAGEDAERWFANVGSVGMSGAVAQRANGMSKALGGKATFFYALTRVFLEWENTEVTVRLDGGERRGRMHDVVVANGVWHGGGMKLAPDARPDDGVFDVVLIGDVGKADFVTTAPKLYKGRHLGHPKVEVLRTARVAVDSPEHLPIELEGEQVGTTPATFEVVRGALRVRVP